MLVYLSMWFQLSDMYVTTCVAIYSRLVHILEEDKIQILFMYSVLLKLDMLWCAIFFAKICSNVNVIYLSEFQQYESFLCSKLLHKVEWAVYAWLMYLSKNVEYVFFCILWNCIVEVRNNAGCKFQYLVRDKLVMSILLTHLFFFLFHKYELVLFFL